MKLREWLELHPEVLAEYRSGVWSIRSDNPDLRVLDDYGVGFETNGTIYLTIRNDGREG